MSQAAGGYVNAAKTASPAAFQVQRPRLAAGTYIRQISLNPEPAASKRHCLCPAAAALSDGTAHRYPLGGKGRLPSQCCPAQSALSDCSGGGQRRKATPLERSPASEPTIWYCLLHHAEVLASKGSRPTGSHGKAAKRQQSMPACDCGAASSRLRQAEIQTRLAAATLTPQVPSCLRAACIQPSRP